MKDLDISGIGMVSMLVVFGIAVGFIQQSVAWGFMASSAASLLLHWKHS